MDRMTIRTIVFAKIKDARNASTIGRKPIILWQHVPDNADSAADLRRLYETFFNSNQHCYLVDGRRFEQIIVTENGAKWVALRQLNEGDTVPTSLAPAKAPAPKPEQQAPATDDDEPEIDDEIEDIAEEFQKKVERRVSARKEEKRSMEELRAWWQENAKRAQGSQTNQDVRESSLPDSRESSRKSKKLGDDSDVTE